MADLLSRLADRTLSRGAEVQPRVVPLFAATQAPGLPEVFSSVPEQDPGAAWDGLSVTTARFATSSTLHPFTGSTGLAPAGLSQGITEPAEHPETPPAVPNRPPGRRQSVSPPAPEQPPAAVVIQEAPVLATLVPPPTGSSPRLPPPLVTSPPGGDAVALSLLENPGELRPVETPRTGWSLVASRTAAVSKASSVSQPTAAGIHQQMAGEEQEPAVRVTIGRIDVRAVLPDPPARPAARPEPRLTIEEYSRQRREGLR